MKEAFEKIRKRIVKLYGETPPIAIINPRIEDVKESNAYLKCLEIVSEVEAEFGKDINVLGNPKTNADHIRAMTDEELAKFLCEQGFCVDERCPRLWDETNCVECIMEWLKSEVK